MDVTLNNDVNGSHDLHVKVIRGHNVKDIQKVDSNVTHDGDVNTTSDADGKVREDSDIKIVTSKQDVYDGLTSSLAVNCSFNKEKSDFRLILTLTLSKTLYIPSTSFM